MHKKILLWVILSLFTGILFCQTQTPRYFSQAITNSNSKGFYQYLPADYSTSGKNYPLIVWIHGAGQTGQGNTTDLPKVLLFGLPNVISRGIFPSSFAVGDSNYSFIVVSPQFMSWPSGGNVTGILNYVVNNYRVDPDRIYLMGMSAGGGAVWENASSSVTNSNRLAAIIPFCGTLTPTQTLANRIAASNLPVWALHNTNDGTVPVSNSRNWKTFINNYIPTPNPLVTLTEFPIVSGDPVIAHDCWTNTTVPTYRVNGKNLYEWLLGFKKRTVTLNIPPVAFAGDDAAVIVPDNLSLSGAGSSDPDGTIVSYRWRKISGPAAYSFTDSTIVNPVVRNLTTGVYSFELTVTDNLNAVSRDTMFAYVSTLTVSGSERRILIDVGPPASVGAITPSPTNGNIWNNMTDARSGVRVSNAKTTDNANTTIGLNVINRIDGTSNTAGNGMNGGNTTPAVGIYPTSATRDFAYAHPSATNGRWKIFGLDADKLYIIKFWGSKSGETSGRDIEIKRSDEAVWKTYGAASNTNFSNAAFFNVTGKTEIDFDIRTKSASSFGYINVVDISWNVTGVNQAPISQAGSNINISLPVDSAVLNGCSSSDPENAVLRFKWRKISGPGSAIIVSDTLCNTKIKNLLTGSHTFELMVTDTGGLSHKDTVAVSVSVAISFAWPVLPPPICPQSYHVVILGSSTAVGTGASPLDSSWSNKLRLYGLQQNTQNIVTNLALGGFSTYQVCPTGFIPGANRPFPDVTKNITAALALNPDAIIINLPSNDAAAAFTIQETQDNLNRIVAAADLQGVPVWVTTSQPRNGLPASQVNSLFLLRDWVNQRFGNKAIDFWTDFANTDGTVNTVYSAGDGVHLNNYGHHIAFSRVLNEKIWDSICLRRISLPNMFPVANAGIDVILQSPADSILLNASGSYDTDGVITGYKWKQIEGNPAILVNDSIASLRVRSLSVGNYLFELTVTDDSLAVDKDTVAVLVNAQPIAIASSDISITLPVNSATVSGLASSDADGTILNFSWRKISGPAGSAILSAGAAQTNISFTTAGAYLFELTVTDNKGGIGKDSVLITVNPDPNVPPVANAGADRLIQLPVNRVTLDGSLSNDANGTISTYQWIYVSGPAGSQLLTPARDTCSVTFINAGIYIFRLSVTDNGGLTASDDVQVNVQAAPATSKFIKVNVASSTVSYNNTQWNNWIPVGNVNSSTFKYSDGTQSSVFVNLLQGGNIYDNGVNYATTSTACPFEVLRINSHHTITRTLTVSGLSPLKQYNFEFYGSRAFTSGSKSIYRTGSIADTINTDFNINDFAKLNNITPDNTGKIVFTLALNGLYHYMAGFTIIEPTAPASVASFSQASISVLDPEPDELQFLYYPNPFKDGITLKIIDQKPGIHYLTLTDMTGKIIWRKNATSITGITQEFIQTKALQNGIYFLQVVTNKKRSVYKLVKQ
ncbi:MAG: T9SS type A sorting domain-containing protein [Gloeobacteraceae cyanobacterium ES-bin-316]|nr:T9SS type A sorting domain-containing protein [Ferruginibacter sp.]